MGPSVLRKRTVSSAESPSVRPAPTAVQASVSTGGVAGGASGPTLKPGKNILEQIGTPDHNGWMRKKGDHYNTWKMRYFVLKGSHLYWLRSNNPTVRLLSLSLALFVWCFVLYFGGLFF